VTQKARITTDRWHPECVVYDISADRSGLCLRCASPALRLRFASQPRREPTDGLSKFRTSYFVLFLTQISRMYTDRGHPKCVVYYITAELSGLCWRFACASPALRLRFACASPALRLRFACASLRSHAATKQLAYPRMYTDKCFEGISNFVLRLICPDWHFSVICPKKLYAKN
jgi:hypothetical protein